jgi:hypothetical protein
MMSGRSAQFTTFVSTRSVVWPQLLMKGGFAEMVEGPCAIDVPKFIIDRRDLLGLGERAR